VRLLQVVREHSKALLLDLLAPRLLEVPPDGVGLAPGRPVRKILMRGGYRMVVDLRVPEQREAWRTGVYEDRMVSAARRLVPDGGVLVDVGANIGFYTCGVGVDLSKRGGTVYAFEPVSSNRRRLLRNIVLNRLRRLVTVLPWALGDEPGSVVMRRTPNGNAGNAVGQNMLSSWDRESVDKEGWPSEEVPVVRLDDWAIRLSRCDVLKIDVEGADLLVLRGGRETLDRFRPVVLAEFNPYWMRQVHQSIDDVRQFTERAGYRIVRLFGDRFLPLDRSHVDADADVPSYVLFPEERQKEMDEVLN
jgi:FkbM family methyltransferase